jgi:hypothetical protein
MNLFGKRMDRESRIVRDNTLADVAEACVSVGMVGG